MENQKKRYSRVYLDKDQINYETIDSKIQQYFFFDKDNCVDIMFRNKRDLFVSLTTEDIENGLVVFQIILGNVHGLERNKIFNCTTVYKDVLYLIDITCTIEEIREKNIMQDTINAFIKIANGLVDLEF